MIVIILLCINTLILYPSQDDESSRNQHNQDSHPPVASPGAPLTEDATQPKKELKQPPQPTSEQLMIAQIIDTSTDDPRKIKQVMDITGKPEDVVATALFDAGWDQNR